MEKMVRLVLKVFKECQVHQVLWVTKVLLVNREGMVILDLLAILDQEAILARMDHLDCLVPQGLQVL